MEIRPGRLGSRAVIEVVWKMRVRAPEMHFWRGGNGCGRVDRGGGARFRI